MREAMGYAAKAVSDHQHKELLPDEIFELFKTRYEGIVTPFHVSSVRFKQDNGMVAQVAVEYKGETRIAVAAGNGRLNAVSNALKKQFHLEYDLVVYQEHALEASSSSRAIAYVGIRERKSGKLYWGAGLDQDIIHASINALLTAINNMQAGIQ